MTTSEIQSQAALLFVAIQQQPDQRPSPEQLDQVANLWRQLKQEVEAIDGALNYIETASIELVRKHGVVPPNAEKSRRLAGNLSEFTLTKADRLTINDERVIDLRDALAADGFGDYFSKLFAERTKFEIVEGAEAALKSESLPKRLASKVVSLWGRCITVTPKKPQLKITLIAPPKPAKRSAKKAVAQ